MVSLFHRAFHIYRANCFPPIPHEEIKVTNKKGFLDQHNDRNKTDRINSDISVELIKQQVQFDRIQERIRHLGIAFLIHIN